MTDEERRMIEALQRDIAGVKKTLARMEETAGDLVSLLDKEGLAEQCADALIFQGRISKALGEVRQAHGVGSKALISGFGSAGLDVVTRGPGR